MEKLQELIEVGKDFTVLYVEDDARLQVETAKMLDRIFKKIFVASDGEEGLEYFKNNEIDLVITDIEMPVMDGLKMSQSIKQVDQNCPIVVVSAYTDVEYFLDAIEFDVDFYVLKPVNTQKLLQTLLKACKHVVDLKLIEAYKRKELDTQIENEKQRMLGQVSNCSPNPMVVFCENELKFSNQIFTQTFEPKSDDGEAISEAAMIKYLNKQIYKDEVLKDIKDLSDTIVLDEPYEKIKVALKTKFGKKIFMIIKNPFDLEHRDKSFLYTFNDITELVYQQAQLALYSQKLDNIVEDKFITKTTINNGIVNKVDF